MSTSADTLSRNPASFRTPASPKVTELTGRILLAALFLISGLGKVGGYAATAAYMSSVGVPCAVLPLVILTEVAGAICIILGWNTRIAAFLLAGFTPADGGHFHSKFRRSDPDDHVPEERLDRRRVAAAHGQWRGSAQYRSAARQVGDADVVSAIRTTISAIPQPGSAAKESCCHGADDTQPRGRGPTRRTH